MGCSLSKEVDSSALYTKNSIPPPGTAVYRKWGGDTPSPGSSFRSPHENVASSQSVGPGSNSDAWPDSIASGGLDNTMVHAGGLKGLRMRPVRAMSSSSDTDSDASEVENTRSRNATSVTQKPSSTPTNLLPGSDKLGPNSNVKAVVPGQKESFHEVSDGHNTHTLAGYQPKTRPIIINDEYNNNSSDDSDVSSVSSEENDEVDDFLAASESEEEGLGNQKDGASSSGGRLSSRNSNTGSGSNKTNGMSTPGGSAIDGEPKLFDKFETDTFFEFTQEWENLKTLKLLFDKAGLAVSQQVRFLKALRPAIFKLGEYIVRQGELGDKFYIITSGEVAVTQNLDENNRQAAEDGILPLDQGEVVLTHLFEGHSFGEMALVTDKPRNANVRAVSLDVRCMSMGKDVFRPFMEQEPKFREIIDELMKKKMATSEQRQKVIAGGPDDAREESNGPVNEVKITYLTRKCKTASGKQVINDYVLMQKLGAGSYGTVWLAEYVGPSDSPIASMGPKFAVKVVSRLLLKKKRFGAADSEDALREVAVMKRLRHRNVVALAEVIDDPNGDKFYMVQEYMELGPVMTEREYNSPLDPIVAREYFRDIVSGLEYLHFQGVVHRDIKPANILISSDGVAKLADFGAAAITADGNDFLSEVKGTPAFQPPEVFMLESGERYHGFAADIWALGATLHALVVGVPPFMADTEFELVEKLKHEDFRLSSTVQMDPHLRHLLMRCLTKDHAQRITLREILTHDWLTEEGSRPLVSRPYIKLNLSRTKVQTGEAESQDASTTVVTPAADMKDDETPPGSEGDLIPDTPNTTPSVQAPLPKADTAAEKALEADVKSDDRVKSPTTRSTPAVPITSTSSTRARSVYGGKSDDSGDETTAFGSPVRPVQLPRASGIVSSPPTNFSRDTSIPNSVGSPSGSGLAGEQLHISTPQRNGIATNSSRRRGSIGSGSGLILPLHSPSSMSSPSQGIIPTPVPHHPYTHSHTHAHAQALVHPVQALAPAFSASTANFNLSHGGVSGGVGSSGLVSVASTASIAQLQAMAAPVQTDYQRAHLRALRQRQLQLLKEHTGLTDRDRDILVDQRRIAFHPERAEAVVEELVMDAGGAFLDPSVESSVGSNFHVGSHAHSNFNIHLSPSTASINLLDSTRSQPSVSRSSVTSQEAVSPQGGVSKHSSVGSISSVDGRQVHSDYSGYGKPSSILVTSIDSQQVYSVGAGGSASSRHPPLMARTRSGQKLSFLGSHSSSNDLLGSAHPTPSDKGAATSTTYPLFQSAGNSTNSMVSTGSGSTLTSMASQALVQAGGTGGVIRKGAANSENYDTDTSQPLRSVSSTATSPVQPYSPSLSASLPALSVGTPSSLSQTHSQLSLTHPYASTHSTGGSSDRTMSRADSQSRLSGGLTRKGDFLMVTANVDVAEGGGALVKKVIFKARGADGSLSITGGRAEHAKPPTKGKEKDKKRKDKYQKLKGETDSKKVRSYGHSSGSARNQRFHEVGEDDVGSEGFSDGLADDSCKESDTSSVSHTDLAGLGVSGAHSAGRIPEGIMGRRLQSSQVRAAERKKQRIAAGFLKSDSKAADSDSDTEQVEDVLGSSTNPKDAMPQRDRFGRLIRPPRAHSSSSSSSESEGPHSNVKRLAPKFGRPLQDANMANSDSDSDETSSSDSSDDVSSVDTDYEGIVTVDDMATTSSLQSGLEQLLSDLSMQPLASEPAEEPELAALTESELVSLRARWAQGLLSSHAAGLVQRPGEAAMVLELLEAEDNAAALGEAPPPVAPAGPLDAGLLAGGRPFTGDGSRINSAPSAATMNTLVPSLDGSVATNGSCDEDDSVLDLKRRSLAMTHTHAKDSKPRRGLSHAVDPISTAGSSASSGLNSGAGGAGSAAGSSASIAGPEELDVPLPNTFVTVRPSGSAPGPNRVPLGRSESCIPEDSQRPDWTSLVHASRFVSCPIGSNPALGIVCGAAASRGTRTSMEDRLVCIPRLADTLRLSAGSIGAQLAFHGVGKSGLSRAASGNDVEETLRRNHFTTAKDTLLLVSPSSLLKVSRGISLAEPLGRAALGMAEHKAGEEEPEVSLQSIVQHPILRDRILEGCTLPAELKFLPEYAFFAVYDGHNGAATAEALSQALHFRLSACLQLILPHGELAVPSLRSIFETSPISAFVSAAAELDSDLQNDLPSFGPISGSTAIMALLRGELRSSPDLGSGPGNIYIHKTLYVANVGDSRAVLCSNGVAADLSSDHKCTRPDERARIIAAGGSVVKDRLHGILAVSRAFGDAEHKKLRGCEMWGKEFSADPLSAVPEITVHEVRDEDEFVVLACDGVWDVLSSQQVVNFVRRRLSVHGDVARASRELVKKALDSSSIDNVTAIVIALNTV